MRTQPQLQRALHINGTSSKVYVAQNALPAKVQLHHQQNMQKTTSVNRTEYKKATNQWDSVQDHTTGNAPLSVNTNVISTIVPIKSFTNEGDLRPSAFNN